MAPVGGNKDNVKTAPFGTKPPAPSDYAHLKAISDVTFARSLSESLPDSRNFDKKKKAKKSDIEENKDSEKNGVEEKEGKDDKKKIATSKIDPEDLARFLESEGGGDAADLCSIPRCMDVISQIILNDKNSKIEKALIQEDILEMMGQLKESEKEEERLNLQAEAQAKELIMLEKQKENQASTLKFIEVKKEGLENEKRSFAGQQALLEKDHRNWVAKFRTAQTALSKAIWRKPGQVYDDDEVSIFEGSVRTIKTSSGRALEEGSQPSALPYEKLANLDRVSDYNEVPSSVPTFPRYVQEQIDLDSINKKRIPGNITTIARGSDQVSCVGSILDDGSVVSYRKSALQMTDSVRSFIACSAAKSLKRSTKNPFSVSHIASGNTVNKADNGSYTASLAGSVSGKKSLTSQRSNRLRPLHGSHDAGALNDEHSVASLSTLGNGSAVTFGADNHRSVTSNTLRSDKNGSTYPNNIVLPKGTGLIRVLPAGMGTLNKKTKSIHELLAEEEALT